MHFIIRGMKRDMKKDRVYICHTYYHAYIAVVKELVARHDKRGSADIVLSTMSNNFEKLPERLALSGVFDNVFMYDEKEDVTSDEVMSYHKDKGNIVANLIQRITYTRLLGKLQEEHIPTDLSAYNDVYVFCDSDPIGYYLNYKKIYLAEKQVSSSKYFELVLNSIYEVLKQAFVDKEGAKERCPKLINDFESWFKDYWNLERYSNNENSVIFDVNDKKSFYKAIIYYISGMTDNYAIEMYNKIIN